MECFVDEEKCSFIQNSEPNDTASSENFQKFITELFEKNCILNNLRAYLRGHIIDVLKSAETGAPPACQKHFTRRLELIYQALNILIAEYLLRLEFSYSLSVFLSEIPLSNMVFDFAQSLLKRTDTDITGLRFNENDVWSILHYLGIKCDSRYASRMIELYKCGELPLIYCILKCIPMYHKKSNSLEGDVVKSFSLDECLSSSAKSADSCEEKSTKHNHRTTHKCKHYAFCKTCQNRVSRLKERCRQSKIKLDKTEKLSSMNASNVQTFMTSVNLMEKSLIDEMFQQLKTVYEAEVEMIKEEEQRKIKRSIASHALQLQKHREEMEESFKLREAELENNVKQKKKFLWGLARALREQHEHMTLAMKDVKHETQRLADKESSLKIQVQEAEQILKKRGEEMRSQISQELIILEGHLETMKRERDSINKERDELESIKNAYETNSKIGKIQNIEESEDIKSHYDCLKDEMVILRKYIESTKLEPKCVVERGTVTDLGDGVMNNESVGVRCDDDRLKGSQVINDLKKPKNVNFSQSNLDEIYRELSRDCPSICSDRLDPVTKDIQGADLDRSSSDYGQNRDIGLVRENRGCENCNRDSVLQLKEENDRLKTFSRQQREHIDALAIERERLQNMLTNTRPRTAPSVMSNNYFTVPRVNPTTSASAFGWRKGAGEELNLFCPEPRIVVPGGTLPFIGITRDRHTDNRRMLLDHVRGPTSFKDLKRYNGQEMATFREVCEARGHLISQWRALRRRLSPHTHLRAAAVRDRSCRDVAGISNAEIDRSTLAPSISIVNTPNMEPLPLNSEKSQQLKLTFNKSREKSPKSVLREAKEKLRNNSIRETPVQRDKSPNAVLREAKMRLRKLEIEAEAVEKSYLDFRKRQSALREERQNLVLAEGAIMKNVKQLDLTQRNSLHRLNATMDSPITNKFNYKNSSDLMKKDFNKYLLEYQKKFDIGIKHFQNKNTVLERLKPIPPTFSKICESTIDAKAKDENYLEKPLIEFRKLYQTQNLNQVQNIDSDCLISNNKQKAEIEQNNKSESERSKREINQLKNIKQAELQILKENINKIYNLPETNIYDDKKNILTSNVQRVNLENSVKQEDKVEIKEDNFLLLEVENLRETNNIGKTESKQDLLLVVESSVDNREFPSENENEEEKISTQMTIIVSPKREISPRSDLKTQMDVTKLTENDVLNAIYHANTNKELSSLDMEIQLTQERIEESEEVAKDLQEAYDDFSADADNYNIYNSISEGGKNSPISLPKTSEDENFWDF